MVFGLLVTLENDYGKRIDIAELSKYETVGDLAHLALSA
jgi:acyl carrier protein